MIAKEVVINSPSGLQVDLAGRFSDTAMKYPCSIKFFYRGDNEANAKSVLSILGAGIKSGESIEIACDGDMEEEALGALVEVLGGSL